MEVYTLFRFPRFPPVLLFRLESHSGPRSAFRSVASTGSCRLWRLLQPSFLSAARKVSRGPVKYVAALSSVGICWGSSWLDWDHALLVEGHGSAPPSHPTSLWLTTVISLESPGRGSGCQFPPGEELISPSSHDALLPGSLCVQSSTLKDEELGFSSWGQSAYMNCLKRFHGRFAYSLPFIYSFNNVCHCGHVDNLYTSSCNPVLLYLFCWPDCPSSGHWTFFWRVSVTCWHTPSI